MQTYHLFQIFTIRNAFSITFEMNNYSKGVYLNNQILHGSAATDLRRGGKLYIVFLCSSSVTVKELRKSVQLWQSYRKNKSDRVFLWSQCIHTVSLKTALHKSSLVQLVSLHDTAQHSAHNSKLNIGATERNGSEQI